MTNLMRWSPAKEMQTIQNQINRMLEPFWRGDLDFALRGPELMSGAWVPAVDIEETSDTLFVRAEIPGMKQEDIDIRFENGVLSIRGERLIENEGTERNFHRVERSYGSFVRSFTLPSSIDPDKATATYTDGVLELKIPKREETKARRISITNSQPGEQK